MREFTVDEAFGIARGTIVVIEGSASEVPARRFPVTVERPDGAVTHTHATIEIPLRRTPSSAGKAALLIEGIDKSQAPRGSIVRIA